MMKPIRKLKADEIEVRVGQFTKDKTKMSLLLYKNARVDMAILDEVVGQMNWQREHKELKGVIYCGVSIRNEQTGEWVTKWDAGTESNTEAQKGEASDSFKRACVNWGIGRELYTSPKIWVEASVSPYDLSVSHIDYNEQGEINDLIIKGKAGVVWQMHKNSAPAAPKHQAQANPTPAKPAPTNDKENDEFTAFLSDIEAAENMQQLDATMTLAKGSPYYAALAHAANNKAKQNGWTRNG